MEDNFDLFPKGNFFSLDLEKPTSVLKEQLLNLEIEKEIRPLTVLKKGYDDFVKWYVLPTVSLHHELTKSSLKQRFPRTKKQWDVYFRNLTAEVQEKFNAAPVISISAGTKPSIWPAGHPEGWVVATENESPVIILGRSGQLEFSRKLHGMVGEIVVTTPGGGELQVRTFGRPSASEIRAMEMIFGREHIKQNLTNHDALVLNSTAPTTVSEGNVSPTALEGTSSGTPPDPPLYPWIEVNPEHVVVGQRFHVKISLSDEASALVGGSVERPKGSGPHKFLVQLLVGDDSHWGNLVWGQSGTTQSAEFTERCAMKFK